ncbi:hypothetical protein KC318_g1551 [Hortaea werneckii]|nr:hypothetical protein KC334_g1605 [Hortaea werneckii]KAI7024102.1 hypothetical protein KC355_g1513 [Hortaea werneckii]KAI7674508.1 hypothetical protein KC318_g1551 [Hortaea werneckii]
MGFPELVDFFTNLSNRFSFRTWEADLMGDIARKMVHTSGLASGLRSVLTRQRKWLKTVLTPINAAYSEVGPVAYNILSALGAQSRSLEGKTWWHIRSSEAATRLGEIVWDRLKACNDWTWKELPINMAIDFGSILASKHRGYTSQEIISAVAKRLKMDLQIKGMQAATQLQIQPELRQPELHTHQLQHQQLQDQQLQDQQLQHQQFQHQQFQQQQQYFQQHQLVQQTHDHQPEQIDSTLLEPQLMMAQPPDASPDFTQLSSKFPVNWGYDYTNPSFSDYGVADFQHRGLFFKLVIFRCGEREHAGALVESRECNHYVDFSRRPHDSRCWLIGMFELADVDGGQIDPRLNLGDAL